jgi:hypothetical protein
MKTGFKEPNAVPKDKKMKSPWNFDAPTYDERTSCYVNAGTHYGVGVNQPVGRQGNPKTTVDALPQSHYGVKTMKIDEVPYKNEVLDIDK